VISLEGSNRGPKKSRPWMWSRWRWVSRICTVLACGVRAAASSRMPVPASRMIAVPSASVTSTQDVLPP
jgi:hypothetical protein